MSDKADPLKPSSRKKCQNFDKKSLRLRGLILRHLETGNYPSKLARMLGISRQVASYHCKKLTELGYLSKESIGYGTEYTITDTGKEFLRRCERGQGPPKHLRLENVAFKYPILREPLVEVDWHKVQMHNWVKQTTSIYGLTVEKTTNNIIIYANTLYGKNSFELYYYARQQCDELALELEERLGILLGRGSPHRKPEFAVFDPLLAGAGSDFELRTDDFYLDNSHTHREVDWRSPEGAQLYLNMPKNLAILAENMRTHVEVMKLIRDDLTLTRQSQEREFIRIRSDPECSELSDWEIYQLLSK